MAPRQLAAGPVMAGRGVPELWGLRLLPHPSRTSQESAPAQPLKSPCSGRCRALAPVAAGVASDQQEQHQPCAGLRSGPRPSGPRWAPRRPRGSRREHTRARKARCGRCLQGGARARSKACRMPRAHSKTHTRLRGPGFTVSRGAEGRPCRPQRSPATSRVRQWHLVQRSAPRADCQVELFPGVTRMLESPGVRSPESESQEAGLQIGGACPGRDHGGCGQWVGLGQIQRQG